MIFPFVSVTAIGIVAGAIMHGRGHAQALLRGVAGAWAGFLLGALIGVVIDVITQSGVWVAILGHIAAIPGTITAFRLAKSSA